MKMPAIKPLWYTTRVEFVPVPSPETNGTILKSVKNALNLRGFLSLIPWYPQFLFSLRSWNLVFLSMGMARTLSERTAMLIMWNRTLAARKYSLFLVLS